MPNTPCHLLASSSADHPHSLGGGGGLTSHNEDIGTQCYAIDFYGFICILPNAIWLTEWLEWSLLSFFFV